MPSGFNYADSPRARRHGRRGYSGYASYRSWLRDEFCFRCVYCLIREQWGRTVGEFDLDHFLPQSLEPHQANDYDNLIYSCATCNVAKGNRAIPDPTSTLTAAQVIVHDDGAISGLTQEAERLIRILDLNDEDYRRWRRTWSRIIELAEQYDAKLHRQLMGFPEDLPNLSRLRPPEGNARPEGIEASYFEQRKRGALAPVY